LCG
jgi:clathrin heavy chain